MTPDFQKSNVIVGNVMPLHWMLGNSVTSMHLIPQRKRNMFYHEEDILPAVELAVKEFGPIGQIIPDTPYKNVSVATREFGKIWYGDMNQAGVREKIQTLKNKLNQNIYIFSADNRFDFTDSVLYSTAT
jgi:hypothetical protein